MKKDIFKIVTFELILLFTLFFTLFVSNIYIYLILAFFLGIYAIVVRMMLKKRNIHSIYKKQVTLMMLFFSIIYVILFYLMGLYFGFYRSAVTFGFTGIFFYIIPLSVIVISSEMIREVILAQKAKISKIIAFISMVLIDLIIYTQVYDITNLDDFLMIIGFVLFASVSCNLLYNYISVRYGARPVIVYRLITVLYAYFIPIIPNVYVFFRSFLRMLYPYIIYMVLEYTYSKSNFVIAYKDKKRNAIATTILVFVMAGIVMLISCQFRYGILVIGSESMTGKINKGDAVVFESYDNQKIREGEVIVFRKDNILVIHRVVRTINVNGENRYFTKGDANEEEDEGYVIKNDIVGVTKFKISYIGYPTIWIRDIFDK